MYMEFGQRKWKNDAYVAIRDCNSARLLDASSFRAHFHMAEALLQVNSNCMKTTISRVNINCLLLFLVLF